MDPEQQQQQRSNRVKDCLLDLVKSLGILLLCPFVYLFGSLYIALILGPQFYYQEKNSNALAAKYTKEGVRLQGKVIARWAEISDDTQFPTTFHVRVDYQVDQDRYVINDMSVNRDLYSKENLDLIRLPDYHKSAVLFASVKGVDPDFPRALSRGPEFYFALFYWTGCNIGLAPPILNSIEACDFCANFVGPPVFCGMIVLEFAVGYWLEKRDRDNNLKSTLYGAKRMARSNVGTGTVEDATPEYTSYRHFVDEGKHSWAADDATPKYMSYSNFFDEGKHSCFSVTSHIVLDSTTVVAWIGFIIYLLVFGGGYMIMYSLVVARWREKILQRYESESTQVLGSIICRQKLQPLLGINLWFPKAVIVQYKVDTQVYKKRLVVPSHIRDDETVLYITGIPASATLKCQIDNRQEEREKFRKDTRRGLLCILIQVGFTTFVGGMLIQSNFTTYTFGGGYGIISPEAYDTQPFILLAGILLACHIILGFIGACIHYEFFFKRELLHGAKRVFPRAEENDELPVDEEQELDIAVSLEQGWDGMNTTQTTTDESVSTETFVDDL